MKRPRPYIPINVRLLVALRQCGYGRLQRLEMTSQAATAGLLRGALTAALNELKDRLGTDRLALDHNPALILRPYNPKIKDPAARYTPNANDPDALEYRDVHAHHIKTNIHGDGAQRSDTSERMHRRRMEENRGLRPRKPKKKIPSRVNPWPKRPFRKA